MAAEKRTVIERILLAADKLGEDGKAFTAEDLVVQAWRLYPEHFGLQGYADKYPDSNRILTKIMGAESGLRKKGWITKVGEKKYRLTDVGVLAAERLRPDNGEASATRRMAGLNRTLAAVLRRMIESPAFEKYRNGQPLTFSDVCRFWNISARSSAHQFSVRTEEAEAAVDQGLVELATAKEMELPGTSIHISGDDLRSLRALSEHVREAFATEIEVIMQRGDERRL